MWTHSDRTVWAVGMCFAWGNVSKYLNTSVFVFLCIDCGRVSWASLLYQPKRTNGFSWAKRCCCFRSQPLLIDRQWTVGGTAFVVWTECVKGMWLSGHSAALNQQTTNRPWRAVCQFGHLLLLSLLNSATQVTLTSRWFITQLVRKTLSRVTLWYQRRFSPKTDDILGWHQQKHGSPLLQTDYFKYKTEKYTYLSLFWLRTYFWS